MATLGLAGGRMDRGAPWPPTERLGLALVYLPVGAFMVTRARRSIIGRCLLATGILGLVGTVAACWSAYLPFAWLSQWIGWPALAPIGPAVALFPDGRLPSRRWAPIIVVLAVSGVVSTAGYAAASLSDPRRFTTSIESVPGWPTIAAQVGFFAIGAYFLALTVALILLLFRLRNPDPQIRGQIRCLVPSLILLVAGLMIDALTNSGSTWLPAILSVPVAMLVAIARYHYLDLDLYLRRDVVWLFLLTVSVIIFGFVVALPVTVLRHLAGWQSALLAGTLVAALLPAERILQRALRRMLYGRRDDPVGVLVAAGRNAEIATEPLQVLPRLAEAIIEQLRAPYVRIEVEGRDPIEQGRLAADAVLGDFAMIVHGSRIGSLRVAERGPGQSYTTSERALLTGLAAHAATAAHTHRVVLDLQNARQRLVWAREEERRRIRHDLHDGVAGSLASARILVSHHRQLDAALVGVRETRQHAERARTAQQSLELLDRALSTCTEEIRDVIDGLRPAVLDHGLMHALRITAAQASTDQLSVGVDVRGQGGHGPVQLPAALEVVVYRVVGEAIANTVRHAAAATTCQVTIDVGPGPIVVEVRDDGLAGEPAPSPRGTDARYGVGTISMRERVEEIGGTLDAGPTPHGYLVRAVFPRFSDQAGTGQVGIQQHPPGERPD